MSWGLLGIDGREGFVAPSITSSFEEGDRTSNFQFCYPFPFIGYFRYGNFINLMHVMCFD